MGGREPGKGRQPIKRNIRYLEFNVTVKLWEVFQIEKRGMAENK